MSSWMMANRATPEAFAEIGDVVAAYRDHWFGHAGRPVCRTRCSAAATAEQIAERDTASRNTIFSAEVDPVWDNIARLLGEEQTTTLADLASR